MLYSYATRKIAAVCVTNEWNEISSNETRFTFTEWFQNSSINRTNRDNIHKTFGGLLTLYLNSHFVDGRVKSTVAHMKFVFSTLRSVQCKDCNFCSCSIDVFLNATLIKTLRNRYVEVYATFDHNDAGGRVIDEPKENSVKRSIQVVLPNKGDIIAFQNRERIWRSCRKCWF